MASKETLSAKPILKVFCKNEHVGFIEFVTPLEPIFYYTSHWLTYEKNFPISISMPLVDVQYQHPLCFNFFDNFLPEGKLRSFFAAAKESSPQNLYQLLNPLPHK